MALAFNHYSRDRGNYLDGFVAFHRFSKLLSQRIRNKLEDSKCSSAKMTGDVNGGIIALVSKGEMMKNDKRTKVSGSPMIRQTLNG
jgi:hypothetical protein